MLVNRTKNVPLTEHVEIADSFWKRAVGLMFKRNFRGALVFPGVGREAFHGFFCFFPILLVCLDKQNRVKEKKMLKPWAVVPVNCATVIELDARKEWAIDEGDELSWNEDSSNGRS